MGAIPWKFESSRPHHHNGPAITTRGPEFFPGTRGLFYAEASCRWRVQGRHEMVEPATANEDAPVQAEDLLGLSPDRLFHSILYHTSPYVCAGRYQIAMVIARPETREADRPVTWLQDLTRPIEYPAAVEAMENRVAAIRAGSAAELVRLLEHPTLYTAGTSALPEDLLEPDRFPVFRTGRGGQYTYHGPGQLVGYVMLDLSQRGSDVRRYVRDLESWLIETLARFGVRGERREGRVGIWVDRGPAVDGNHREDKIAAIGVRVRRWVSYHGVSINVEPDLTHFSGIVPCGIADHGVTSLVDLGITATVEEVADIMRQAFHDVFKREISTE